MVAVLLLTKWLEVAGLEVVAFHRFQACFRASDLNPGIAARKALPSHDLLDAVHLYNEDWGFIRNW